VRRGSTQFGHGRCALGVLAALERIGVSVRSGLHTGECEVVGEKLAGSQSTPALGSQRWQARGRCSSRRRCTTSWPARGSSSTTGGFTRSGDWAIGVSSRWGG